MSSLDVFRTERWEGANPACGVGEVEALLENLQTQMDANISSLIGTSGYEQYQSFTENMPASSLLEQTDAGAGSTLAGFFFSTSRNVSAQTG